jgi:hypothetical protein
MEDERNRELNAAFGLWNRAGQQQDALDYQERMRKEWTTEDIPTVEMPALPLTGGCQCGRVRYRIDAVPYVFYLCHCTECQRHTSSAFGESLRVKSADLEIEGELKTFRRLSESGKAREGHFCPHCGVRIVHGTTGSDMVNVKAGTLDDARWLVPAGHIWTRSKQAFVRLREDEIVYDGQPQDAYTALAERWRRMLGNAA